MRYAVVYEKGKTGYGAYVPDLPGCIAVGKTLRRVQRLIKEAIELHLDAMREDGDPIPMPTSVSENVAVSPHSRRSRGTSNHRLTVARR